MCAWRTGKIPMFQLKAGTRLIAIPAAGRHSTNLPDYKIPASLDGKHEQSPASNRSRSIDWREIRLPRTREYRDPLLTLSRPRLRSLSNAAQTFQSKEQRNR